MAKVLVSEVAAQAARAGVVVEVCHDGRFEVYDANGNQLLVGQLQAVCEYLAGLPDAIA